MMTGVFSGIILEYLYLEFNEKNTYFSDLIHFV